MAAEVALTQDFKTVLREKVLSTFMGLIPQEQIDKLVTEEINAFFYTERLLTVENTKVELDNPVYSTNAYHERSVKRECLDFGSKMTPFRQLVWTVLHEELLPRVQLTVQTSMQEATGELNTWFKKHFEPDLKDTADSLFTRTAIGMAAIQQRATMLTAIDTSRASLVMAFQNTGLDIGKIPSMMFPIPAPNEGK